MGSFVLILGYFFGVWWSVVLRLFCFPGVDRLRTILFQAARARRGWLFLPWGLGDLVVFVAGPGPRTLVQGSTVDW